jgi:hypothetical protein
MSIQPREVVEENLIHTASLAAKWCFMALYVHWRALRIG